MSVELLYPMKFQPILQEKIWGGDKLSSQFNKKSIRTNIGESWELSGVKNSISIVECVCDSVSMFAVKSSMGHKNFSSKANTINDVAFV